MGHIVQQRREDCVPGLREIGGGKLGSRLDILDQSKGESQCDGLRGERAGSGWGDMGWGALGRPGAVVSSLGYG